jgi:lipoyl(octanoyl) transferase
MQLGIDVLNLGLQDYQSVWRSMSDFTDNRSHDTKDQLWLVQHTPVFTQGQAGKADHLLNPGSIPVVQSDRGGQVTYHGPGQLVLYPLIDLRRRNLGVRAMITLLEQVAVELMAFYDVVAFAKADAPGVYIHQDGRDDKIGSLGLRVRRGCCFHGMSINVDMDLSPFKLINPCGYSGLRMTQLSDCVIGRDVDYNEVETVLVNLMTSKLDIL